MLDLIRMALNVSSKINVFRQFPGESSSSKNVSFQNEHNKAKYKLLVLIYQSLDISNLSPKFMPGEILGG